MRSHTSFQIASLALLLLAGLAPAAEATHLAPNAGNHPQQPWVPEEPLGPLDGGLAPVDREEDNAVRQANGTVGSAYTPADSALDGLPEGYIHLYRDGAGLGPSGPDRRLGAFGDWAVLQDRGEGPAWNRRPGAGNGGSAGFTLEREGGSYPPNTLSMLLTPELDLQTDFVDAQTAPSRSRVADEAQLGFGAGSAAIGAAHPVAAGALQDTGAAEGEATAAQAAAAGMQIGAQTVNATVGSLTVSGIWNAVMNARVPEIRVPYLQICLVSGNPNCTVQLCGDPTNLTANLLTRCPTNLGVSTPPDALVQLRFDARYNLASRQDTVQIVVFTQRPASPPLFGMNPPTCAFGPPGGVGAAPGQTCFIVTPLEGYNNQPANNRPSPAFTGWGAAPASWQRYTLDLTPWAGQRVWVGFILSSLGEKSLDNGGFFSRTAGFHGFQLDNLDLTSPAPEVSVRVREPTSPSGFPPGCDPCFHTIAPGTNFTVRGDVLNTGFRPITVRVTTSILGEDGTLLPGEAGRTYGHTDDPVEIGPGLVLPVEVPFLGIPPSPNFLYQARIRAELVTDDGPGGADGVPEAPRAPVGQPLADSISDDAEGATEGAPRGPGSDPDPSNDQADHAFAARIVESIIPGVMTRSQPSAKRGDSVTFTLPFANLGTVPVALDAKACVIDMGPDIVGPRTCVTEKDGLNLLRLEDIDPEEDVVLQPGESRTLQWEAKGARAGQYRLFVTVNDDTPFSELDLQGENVPPLFSSYTQQEVPLTTATLDGTPWKQAEPHAISLRLATPDPQSIQMCNGCQFTRPGTLRLLNDNDTLYLRLDVGWPLQPSSPRDLLALRLHDVGSPPGGPGATDGFFFNGTSRIDQRFDPAALAWVPDAVQNVSPGLRQFTTVQGVNNYTYMLSRPLGGGEDVAAAPGDLLGLFLRVARDAPNVWSHPFGASDLDGGIPINPTVPAGLRDGLLPPDGKLDDEVASWRLLRLGRPIGDDGVEAFSRRFLSPGYGIDRNPAPYFAEDFSDCGSVQGWAQSRVHGAQSDSWRTPSNEKWNCAYYPAEGRELTYAGLSPGTCENNRPCPPWNWQGFTSSSGSKFGLVLATPPIGVPAVEQPYLVLNHQYATDARIIDNPQDFSPPRIQVKGQGRVYMQVEVPGQPGVFGPPVMLVPEGNGYTTEEQVGIYNPQAGLRPLNSDVGSNPAFNPANPSRCDGQIPTAMRCGFWWPTGPQPLYQPAGEAASVGAAFSGSPWIVERIPLFGTALRADGLQTASATAAGSTVRLLFEWAGSSETGVSINNPYGVLGGHDYGWRIGGLTVQEGRTFQRDLAVADVRVKPGLYDASALGLGPDAPVLVNVTLRNGGELDATTVRVQLRGFDPTLSGDAATLCSADEVRTVRVPAGAAANVTVACTGTQGRPGLPDGAFVRFRAEAAATVGDDSPADNGRTSAETYAVRRFPDVAIRVDATPGSASQDTPRQLFAVVENRGNVPLQGVQVSLTVLQKAGAQGSDILRHSNWTLAKALPIRAAYSIADLANLPLQPPIVPLADLRFLPQDPGAYEVVARVGTPGDRDVTNDADVALLEARDRLYTDAFDGEPFATPGVVSGERSFQGTPGTWSVSREGGWGSQRLLAGDPGTSEIPADADAAVLLPEVDLTTVRGATVTLLHRYDLEPSFDGGRLEICTEVPLQRCDEGDAAWRGLQPVPQPLAGLPHGHPSLPVLGASPFLGGEAERVAAAFTGRSEDLAEEGKLRAEFDLSQDPALRRTANVEEFRLDGFAPRPPDQPRLSPQGDLEFRDDSWLAEPGGEARQRYWWIDNLADDVKPRSGSAMWWSGPGAIQPDNGPQPSTGTDLRYTLQVPALRLQAGDLEVTGANPFRRVSDPASGVGASVIASSTPTARVLYSESGAGQMQTLDPGDSLYYRPSTYAPRQPPQAPWVAPGDVRLTAFQGLYPAGTTVQANDADVGRPVGTPFRGLGGNLFATPFGAFCFVDLDRDGGRDAGEPVYLVPTCNTTAGVAGGDVRMTASGAFAAGTVVRRATTTPPVPADADTGQPLTAIVGEPLRFAFADPNGNRSYDAGEPVYLSGDPTQFAFSFWDWRPGADEGSLAQRLGVRYGTGADYLVSPSTFIDMDQDGMVDLREGGQAGAVVGDTNSDDDNWLDGIEACVGSDPGDGGSTPADATGDKVADAWLASWPPPFSPKTGANDDDDRFQGKADLARDGLSNAVEQANCTNPFSFDTDGDSLGDREEVTMGSDPLVPFWMGRAVDHISNTARILPGALPGPDGQAPLTVDGDGWTRRELDVTAFAGQGLTLWFQYHSRSLPKLPQSSGTPTPGDSRSLAQSNPGWFVDDVALTSYRIDPTTGLRTNPAVRLSDSLEGLVPDANGAAGPWTPFLNSQGNLASPRWGLVEQAAARPSGWHVAAVEVPGRGEVAAWRFNGTGVQGYPKGEESRLVTPVMDLGSFGGTRARLQFDHRYALEGSLRCPHQTGRECLDVTGAFLSAVDAAAVEYQVYDPATQAFGPWLQLGQRFRDFPDRLFLDSRMPRPSFCRPTPPGTNDADCWRRSPDLLSAIQDGPVANRGRIGTTGYPAILLRGDYLDVSFKGNPPPSYFTFDSNPRLAYAPLGPGYGFETWPGLSRVTLNNGEGGRMLWDSMRDAPVSYVFSGVSQGVQGWSSVDWDISPLVGQKVRFAFHVASDPSAGSDPIVGPDLAASPPEQRGWTVANVAVKGDVFDGKPARLRLRVATDGTLTKGEWSVDDVTIVGDRYQRNAAVLSDSPDDVLVTPGSTVELAGRIANLGVLARSKLAIAVIASDNATREDATDGVVLDAVAHGAPLPRLDAPLPNDLANAQAWGPFGLQGGGETGSSVPFRVTVSLPPDADKAVRLRAVLLESQASGAYGPAANEVSGTGTHDWLVRADTRLVIGLVPPAKGLTTALVADPGLPEPGGNVTLKAAVRNDGTKAAGLRAEWALLEVGTKGDPATQPGTREERILDRQDHGKDLPVLGQESTTPVEANFTLNGPGLYRGTLRILAGDVEQARGQLEFLVGETGRYHGVDFAALNASDLGGWRDASAVPLTSGGGSPPALQFRRDGDRLIWGVSDLQLLQNLHYCSTAAPVRANCNGRAAAAGGPNGQGPPPPPQMFWGLEGIAEGPVIDLSRVPQGSAIVTLRHSLNFQPGDGARLEALPLKADSLAPGEVPEAAFDDCNGDDAWFIVPPLSGGALADRAQSVASSPIMFVAPPPQGQGTPAQSPPHQMHPLSPGLTSPSDPSLRVQPILGGSGVRSTLTQFALDPPAKPVSVNLGQTTQQAACAQAGDKVFSAVELVNYPVQLRLRAGTQPGYIWNSGGNLLSTRTGAQGWQVEAIEVSSTGLSASPASRTVPLLDGAAKRMAFQLTNLGQVPDEVVLELDPLRSSLPDPAWVQLPGEPIPFAAGERKTVQFGLDIPADPSLSRGTYIAHIVARSLRSPTTTADTEVAIQLLSNPLPDLAIDLSGDAGQATSVPTYQVGTVAPLFAKVSNLGQLSSKPVAIRLSATRDGSSDSFPLESLAVRALCPKACGAGHQVSLPVEWLVPAVPGNYTVRAEVDAEGRIQDGKRSNNVAYLPVRAVPLRAPDVAVTALVVDGVGSDGYAEKGALLTVRANVTNLGFLPASDVQVRLLSGSSELTSVLLPSLPAGETRVVQAFKQASEGEHVLRAIVVPSPSELRADNNEMRRVVRVRSHDLNLSLDPPVLGLDPGGLATAFVTVANNGTTVESVLVSVEEKAGWAFSVEPNPVLVAPRSQSLAVLTIKAPADALSGLHLLAMAAAPASNPRAGASALLRVNVTTLPGTPAVALDGLAAEPGPANLTVRLLSTSNAAQDLRLVLAQPGWNHTAREIRLDGRSNRTVALPLVIPPGAPPGNATVVVQAVDASGEPVAQASASVLVKPRAAIEASWLGALAATTSAPGTRSLALTLRVANTGNVPVVANAAARDLPVGIVVPTPPEPMAIAPGAEGLLRIVLAAAADAPQALHGQVDVFIRNATAGGAGVGVVARTLDVPQPGDAPDLRIARIDVFPRGDAAAGQPVKVVLDIENVGKADSPPVRVEAYSNGYLLDDPQVPRVPAGGHVAVELPLHFQEAGTYLLTFVADAEASITELTTDNNARSVPLAVREPDLVSVEGIRHRAPAPAATLVALLLVALALFVSRRRGEDGP